MPVCPYRTLHNGQHLSRRSLGNVMGHRIATATSGRSSLAVMVSAGMMLRNNMYLLYFSRREGRAMESLNKHVAVGKDGWLFLRAGTNHVSSQLNGTYPLPDDFEQQWRLLFEYRKKTVEKHTSKYSFLVVPNKECVYADFLPDDIKVTDRRPVFNVLKQAEGLVETLYPLEGLVEQSRSVDVFPRCDSHWNHYGFNVAYRQLMKSWGLKGVADSDLLVQNGQMNDLGSKLNMEISDVPYFAKVKAPRHKVIVDNKIKPLGNLFISEIDDPSLPTCVVFRDSFMTISTHILAQSFRRLVIAWQPNIDYGILEREKPDFVLSQQAERFLVACPDDVHGKTNEEYVAQKLAKSLK